MRATVFWVTAVGLLLLDPRLGQAAIFSNGDFETGDFSSWFEILPTDPLTTIQGVDQFQPHSGTYGAYFGTLNEISGIRQVFDTTPGTEYTLSFWLQNEATGTNFFQALWDGAPVRTLTNHAEFSYTQYAVNVTASGSSAELEFVFSRDDAFYWDLDDVSLSAVPEPTSLMAWWSLSLIALGSAYRRRTRQPKTAIS